jgi:hypothetical protein
VRAERLTVPPQFTPVVLTLETQEEVDKVFAIFNFARIVDAVGLPDAYEHLDRFTTKAADKYHSAIGALFK